MSDTHDRWIRARRVQRHDCESELPLHPRGAEDDLWVCPICRRRWHLAIKQVPGRPPNPISFMEGVSLRGPDRSVYWRPFRARFMGRLGIRG